MNTQNLRSVYFVGIKGVAMTALAIYCKEKGMAVAGSDVAEEFPTKESLEKAGITPLQGFSERNISSVKKPDLVIFTGAHGGCDNPEVRAAKNLGIEVMPHGRALGFFMDGSVQISVAGSHGKTTTTAMIATILTKAGRDPSYAVGCGDIRGLGFSGHFGKGREFVAEADEYVTDPTHDRTPRFLWQHPHILVVTNIDYDHPDAYDSLDDVQDAFVRLQKQQEGARITVVNLEDPNSSVLLENSANERMTYGLTKKADVSATRISFQKGKTIFDLVFRGMDVGSFTLAVPGRHNISNALAAIAACVSLNVSWEEIRKGLAAFGGTKRRFEFIGEAGSIRVYDDYAHHPHEIEATLQGVKDWYPESRIITIFQPHTYSRTKALLREFGKSFKKSSVVLIPDIYASARENDQLGVTSGALVEEISKYQKDVYYIKNLDGTLAYLKKNKKDNDIILCMGAGDIYWWGEKIIQALQ